MMGHPRGLFVLFSTELWERFSFYSMRAFLTLYITKAMLLSKESANEIYGAYLGFVYAAPFIGGMLADRILGQRRAIVIGGFLMAAAQFVLAAHAYQLSTGTAPGEFASKALFFLGLGLLSAGNGFFKPNISSIVGSLYKQGDPRRDGAFTIFYMGINIGAALAGISGDIAENKGWYWGFLIAGIGMLVGQVIFFIGSGWLHGKGLPPEKKEGATASGSLFGTGMISLGVMLFVPLAAYMMANPSYVQNLAMVVAIPVLVYLIWEIARAAREDAQRMIVILVLVSFSMMFWMFFELAGSALNLFTDEKVNRTVSLFGWEREFSASSLTASINPIFIILFAPIFAKLWVWLSKLNAEPSSPLKFALGLLQLGVGFFVMYLGAMQAGETGKCNLAFMVIGFMLHTTGELCLSPVGLSTITKLSPIRMVSTFMGVWFLSSAFGNVLGGIVGGKTEQAGFGPVFFWIAACCGGAALLLFLLVIPLKRMMHGVK